jgi:hypothetical protein
MTGGSASRCWASHAKRGPPSSGKGSGNGPFSNITCQYQAIADSARVPATANRMPDHSPEGARPFPSYAVRAGLQGGAPTARVPNALGGDPLTIFVGFAGDSDAATYDYLGPILLCPAVEGILSQLARLCCGIVRQRRSIASPAPQRMSL